MLNTPRGMRLHIGIFGRRNVGKSSILNRLLKQEVSIVSDIAGTTTDPVEKAMELLPLGPVIFLDTAGIDDEGSLGEKRIEKTKKIIERTDVAIIVSDLCGWGEFENALYRQFQELKIPVIAVINKTDKGNPDNKTLNLLKNEKLESVNVSALNNTGFETLKQSIIKIVPEEFLNTPSIAGDLLSAGETAVLVVPIDLEAPKGRLILPQVQTIRDLLDNDAITIVVKERELKAVLDNLKIPPALVITDSQAFLKVSADVPKNIKLTSFSILFARYKGDLTLFTKGVMAVENLREGDKVLICESCTHHAIGDDIGRVKIPRWLTQYKGVNLDFHMYAGHDFPENIEDYKLIIHCGACMTNRREILYRISKAEEKNIPVTNYGLIIAYSLGIFKRAISPFPMAKLIYEEEKNKRGIK